MIRHAALAKSGHKGERFIALPFWSNLCFESDFEIRQPVLDIVVVLQT